MAIKSKAKKRIPLYTDDLTDKETEQASQALKKELWAERLTEEIISPFSGDLFGEDLQGVAFWASFSTPKRTRRSLATLPTGKRKPTEQESRNKRNARLWEKLYPTTKKVIKK